MQVKINLGGNKTDPRSARGWKKSQVPLPSEFSGSGSPVFLDRSLISEAVNQVARPEGKSGMPAPCEFSVGGALLQRGEYRKLFFPLTGLQTSKLRFATLQRLQHFGLLAKN